MEAVMKKHVAVAFILIGLYAGSCIFGSDDSNQENEQTVDVGRDGH